MVAETTLISVEEYLGTEYDPSCDYIDGVLRRKSMPAFDHGRAQFRICALVERFAGFCAAPEQSKRCRQYDSGGRPTEIPPDGNLAAGPIILSHADIFESL